MLTRRCRLLPRLWSALLLPVALSAAALRGEPDEERTMGFSFLPPAAERVSNAPAALDPSAACVEGCPATWLERVALRMRIEPSNDFLPPPEARLCDQRRLLPRGPLTRRPPPFPRPGLDRVDARPLPGRHRRRDRRRGLRRVPRGPGRRARPLGARRHHRRAPPHGAAPRSPAEGARAAD